MYTRTWSLTVFRLLLKVASWMECRTKFKEARYRLSILQDQKEHQPHRYGLLNGWRLTRAEQRGQAPGGGKYQQISSRTWWVGPNSLVRYQMSSKSPQHVECISTWNEYSLRIIFQVTVLMPLLTRHQEHHMYLIETQSSQGYSRLGRGVHKQHSCFHPQQSMILNKVAYLLRIRWGVTVVQLWLLTFPLRQCLMKIVTTLLRLDWSKFMECLPLLVCKQSKEY